MLVVSGRFLHISVTKFQDKFASLQQVNSPYRWNKFQICCTDMYFIRFLPNFAVFFVFLWISQDFAHLPEFRGSTTEQNIRSPDFNQSSYLGRSDQNDLFHLKKLLSRVPLFCILLTRTITKRGVAWVRSVQLECTAPLGTWNFPNQNFYCIDSAL